MSAVRLSPEAVAELAEGAGRYAAWRPGLDVEFLAEVKRVFRLVALHLRSGGRSGSGCPRSTSALSPVSASSRVRRVA